MDIRRPTVTIGSDADNDIVLEGVASRHGEFRLRGGVWTFAPFRTALGSWIDDDSVQSEALLAPGSTLRLGDVTLLFDPQDHWEDSPQRPSESRGVMMMPESSAWPVWPTLIFVLATCGVIAAALLLLRNH